MEDMKKEAYHAFKELDDEIKNKCQEKLKTYGDMLDDEMAVAHWYTLGFSDGRKCPGLKWHCAKTNPPPVLDSVSCSLDVLVIRDCGPGTLESYAITSYWPAAEGSFHWRNQETHGYRVTKWCELPPSESQVINKV